MGSRGLTVTENGGKSQLFGKFSLRSETPSPPSGIRFLAAWEGGGGRLGGPKSIGITLFGSVWLTTGGPPHLNLQARGDRKKNVHFFLPQLIAAGQRVEL